MKKEHDHTGSNLKDIILGGQDGLVNVLGIILGVAAATFNTKLKKSSLINLLKEEYENPKKSAFIVGLSAIIGSLIPLVPFFFLPVKISIKKVNIWMPGCFG